MISRDELQQDILVLIVCLAMFRDIAKKFGIFSLRNGPTTESAIVFGYWHVPDSSRRCPAARIEIGHVSYMTANIITGHGLRWIDRLCFSDHKHIARDTNVFL